MTVGIVHEHRKLLSAKNLRVITSLAVSSSRRRAVPCSSGHPAPVASASTHRRRPPTPVAARSLGHRELHGSRRLSIRSTQNFSRLSPAEKSSGPGDAGSGHWAHGRQQPRRRAKRAPPEPGQRGGAKDLSVAVDAHVDAFMAHWTDSGPPRSSCRCPYFGKDAMQRPHVAYRL